MARGIHKNTSETLIDLYAVELLGALESKTPEERREYFAALGPGELRGLSELVLKHRPIREELEENVLSLTKSLEKLDEIEDLSKALQNYFCLRSLGHREPQI